MKQSRIVTAVGVLVAMGMMGVALANPPPPAKARLKAKAKVDRPWEARADKNKDGLVGPREAAAAARRNRYLRARSDVDRPWEKLADTDGDGRVDGMELRVYHIKRMDANGDGVIQPAERVAYWKRARIVDTEIERKYDRNGDGFLEWPEVRELLKDRYALIVTQGQAKVDTDFELEFDADQDGVIDKTEAAALKAALEG
jgi:hypothetical protein